MDRRPRVATAGGGRGSHQQRGRLTHSLSVEGCGEVTSEATAPAADQKPLAARRNPGRRRSCRKTGRERPRATHRDSLYRTSPSTGMPAGGAGACENGATSLDSAEVSLRAVESCGGAPNFALQFVGYTKERRRACPELSEPRGPNCHGPRGRLQRRSVGFDTRGHSSFSLIR